MPGIALNSAAKGRPRPSFFFLLTLFAGATLAQQPVYRCGQEYTNAPLDASRCEVNRMIAAASCLIRFLTTSAFLAWIAYMLLR